MSLLVRIEQLNNVELKSADIWLTLSSSTGQVIRITRDTFNRVRYSNRVLYELSSVSTSSAVRRWFRVVPERTMKLVYSKSSSSPILHMVNSTWRSRTVPALRAQSSVRPAGKPGSSTEAVCSLGQLLQRDRRTLRVSGVSYERN